MNIKYYQENIDDFIENTEYVDMSEAYSLFEKYLPEDAKILDLGFGSGRDIIYFAEKYQVVGIDPVEGFVKRMRFHGYEVYQIAVEKMNFVDGYDGIWACASLLHIRYQDLPKALDKCYSALNDNGVVYMSFKYGDFEGLRNDRYFTDLNEDRLDKIIDKDKFKILEIKLTNDARPNNNGCWLNAILQKI